MTKQYAVRLDRRYIGAILTQWFELEAGRPPTPQEAETLATVFKGSKLPASPARRGSM